MKCSCVMLHIHCLEGQRGVSKYTQRQRDRGVMCRLHCEVGRLAFWHYFPDVFLVKSESSYNSVCVCVSVCNGL